MRGFVSGCLSDEEEGEMNGLVNGSAWAHNSLIKRIDPWRKMRYLHSDGIVVSFVGFNRGRKMKKRIERHIWCTVRRNNEPTHLFGVLRR